MSAALHNRSYRCSVWAVYVGGSARYRNNGRRGFFRYVILLVFLIGFRAWKECFDLEVFLEDCMAHRES